MGMKIRSDDTITAVSTPIGEGGIGIVRLSGPDAIKIAGKIFVSKDGRKPSDFKTYTVHYGHIVGSSVPRTAHFVRVRGRQGPGARVIDEVLLTVMRAPKSYTKEDVVEINCHSGIQAVKRMLDLVLESGARLAEPGEFTKRAFLNGRLDLAQAEAVLDIIRAKTENSLKVAVSQLEGALSAKVGNIMDAVIDIASQVEASIDFPEEDVGPDDTPALIKKTQKVLGELKELIDSYGEGSVLREGVLAIICGKPNVGKSSLMNLLLKRDRVIVSPVPGTTRDAIEEMISLKGVPIRIVDTAGIAEARDLIEKEGIRRSKNYIALADIAILMLDASSKIEKADTDIVKLLGGKRKLVALNKTDLAKKTDGKDLDRIFKKDKVVEISVTNKTNIDLLEKSLLDMIWSGRFSQGEAAIVSNARHKELLDKAYGHMLSVSKALKAGTPPELIALDLKEAAFDLGLIIGKSVSADILDRIFEKFCIGK